MGQGGLLLDMGSRNRGCAASWSENVIQLSAPIGLANHQWGHLLGRRAVVSQANATATAWIPTQGEELGLQEESVFFQLAEHNRIRTFPAECQWTITLPLSTNGDCDFRVKIRKSSPLGTALLFGTVRRVCAIG